MEEYPALWAGSIRGVGKILPILAKDNDEFSKEWAIWKSFSNKQTKPGSEDEMHKQLSMLIKVVASLNPKAARRRPSFPDHARRAERRDGCSRRYSDGYS